MTEQDVHLFTRAVAVFAASVQALAEIEGMKAHNDIQKIREEYPSFTKDDFEAIADKNGLGCNTVQSSLWPQQR